MAIIKNIISGSIDGIVITGSLDVSRGITGSLFGTASFVTTASFALNAAATFPFSGSAQITGSIGITGSLNVVGGNVGIGTTSPTVALQVAGAISASGQILNRDIIRANTNNANGTARIGTYFNNTSIAQFVNDVNAASTTVYGFMQASDGTNYIAGTKTLIQQGNVGLGTDSPAYKLDVLGSSRIQATSGSASNIILELTAGSGSNDAYIDYGWWGAGFDASLWQAGNYGSDSNRWKIRSTNTGTTFDRLVVENTGNVYMATTGSVGIGTTSPAYKLDINASGSTGVRIYSGSLAVGNIVPTTTVGRIDASNDVVAFSTSDKRLKENIQPISESIYKIQNISGVQFNWKPEHENIHGYEGNDVGVIAQEIKKVLPEAIRENDTGYLAVRYEKIIPLLVEAIKDQQKQINELKIKIDELTS